MAGIRRLTGDILQAENILLLIVFLSSLGCLLTRVKISTSNLFNLFVIPLIVVQEAITSSTIHIVSSDVIFCIAFKSSSFIFIPLGDNPESFLLTDGRRSFFSSGTFILVQSSKI
jgi:hypothetical protein